MIASHSTFFIQKHNIFNGGQSPLTRSVSLCEEFMRSTLELLLELSVTSSVVLIIGRYDTILMQSNSDIRCNDEEYSTTMLLGKSYRATIAC
jgi:hypothetical protein